jgi:hypothetical protein
MGHDLNYRQLNARMPSDEVEQGIAKAPDGGREVGPDDKLADQARALGPCSAGGSIQLDKHTARPLEEARTSTGRPDARWTTLKQRHAEKILESTEAPADGGRGHAKVPGCEPYAAKVLYDDREHQ